MIPGGVLAAFVCSTIGGIINEWGYRWWIPMNYKV